MRAGFGGAGRSNSRSLALGLTLCCAVFLPASRPCFGQSLLLTPTSSEHAWSVAPNVLRLPPTTVQPAISGGGGAMLPSQGSDIERPHGADSDSGWDVLATTSIEEWSWQVLPSGLIYRSYLAGAKEPRIGTAWTFDGEGNRIWDTTLGGRAAILRHGTTDTVLPDGWELDIEGAAMVRLHPHEESTPVIGTDFRFGVPLTYGNGPWRYKFAYYHLSAHAGDEFLLANPGFLRINYVRESLVWGLAYYWTPDVRLYGEVGYALSATDGAEPVEFQVGLDYSPIAPTSFRPSPFAAINCHLREDVDFGGNVVLQAGWQWRGASGGHLFRTGMEYYNGKSPQFEFFNQDEQRIGFGLWYDY